MEFGSKLEELNMTTDEINSFTKAMKDNKFRELLQEYAQELSNPENKKKYEEEIVQLEQERGMEVKFIYPNAHHVLKTSVNGKEKCFINICSNSLISKPTCEARRAENGHVGQCWLLPYSLTPGRPDRDSKGNHCMIYDVVFHPDTLYMAEKNTKFMKLVNSTATQGVEDAFNVMLDKANVSLKTKKHYKGVPQPAVIRKPISGQPGKEESALYNKDRPIIYPDSTPLKNSPTSSSFHSQSSNKQHSLLPIQPYYTIKYRSFVDLQDYRCSRDSAPSPWPKEIVITIDLPLIKSAADVNLNVTDRKLVLESEKPDYKLELLLSYPVDDNKGDAKFNKAKKQLTIILAIQPAKTPAVVQVEENHPKSDRDVMESADEMEVVLETEPIKDEQSKLNLQDTSCDAQPQENRSVQQEDKEEVEEDVFSGTKSVQATAVNPENCTQVSFMSKVEKGPQFKIPVVGSERKKAAIHLEETLHDVQNGSVKTSNWVKKKSEDKPSAIIEEPNKLDFLLDKDTIEDSFRQKVIVALSDDQHTSTKLSSNIEPPNEQRNNTDSSKQSKTDFSVPAIPKRKNTPEDGSEHNIIGHNPSATLSLQNTLWFELD